MSLTVRMQSPEFVTLPAEQRANVLVWEEVMTDVDNARNKLAVCKEWAMRNGHRRGWSPVRIRSKYYEWLAAQRSWMVLVDWARVPRQPAPKRKGLASAFKYYIECNQRACKPAHAQMLRDLWRGVHIKGVGTWRDVWMEQNPGRTPPEDCPPLWIPVGWKYENMMRKYKSTKFELTVMRKGAVAARQFAPPVYSSRVGLECGRLYQFDDVWHDVVVAVPGVNRKLMRPLEFGAIDVASTYKIGYGIKAQIQREDGTREGLGKALFKSVIAHVLCNIGYHPDGCVFVIELGTASLNEKEQALISTLTGDKVTFRTSEPLGAQILKGILPGQSKGNFKAKALIEGSHRLPHYAAAALPAQTGGQARVDDPEQLYGVEKYAEKVLRAWNRVPAEIRDQLWVSGALTIEQYKTVIGELYGAIYDRTDHRIEGWEENGWMQMEWSVDGISNWMAARDIPLLPAVMQDVGRRALNTPGLTRCRRLSPREVWEKGSGNLTRLPLWMIVDFLGEACYRTVNVGHNGLMEFQDRDMLGAPRKVRFLNAVQCPDGSAVQLAEGCEYGLYVVPQDTSRAVVVDAKTRAVVGIAPAWSAVDPMNAAQVETMVEAQARMIAYQAAGVRERHADDSDAALVRKERTDLILAGLGKPAKKKKSTGKETRLAFAALAGASKSKGGACPPTEVNDEW